MAKSEQVHVIVHDVAWAHITLFLPYTVVFQGGRSGNYSLSIVYIGTYVHGSCYRHKS